MVWLFNIWDCLIFSLYIFFYNFYIDIGLNGRVNLKISFLLCVVVIWKVQMRSCDFGKKEAKWWFEKSDDFFYCTIEKLNVGTFAVLIETKQFYLMYISRILNCIGSNALSNWICKTMRKFNAKIIAFCTTVQCTHKCVIIKKIQSIDI